MRVSGVMLLNTIVIAVSRVYWQSPWLISPQQTQVMIKPTCSGSCMMQEQASQNTSCGLMLGLESKPSGQVRIGALLL
ncbi:hypothetical protein EV401DRAFT_2046162 [Pisolithus croceorrhizus]|nr:hypothetical protein EV401DRAFT_2046162 [Pisolithus croceorrhizus]